MPQFVGISIIEPNAAGSVADRLGLVAYVDEAARKSRRCRDRVVFWPRTCAALLVTNRRDGGHAVYGKIRLLGPRRR